METKNVKTSTKDLLKSFIQRNKQARERHAQLKGFASAADYIDFLKGETPKKSNSSKPNIHVIDLVDTSGSMGGGRIAAANKGINDGIISLKKDTIANYTYSLISFNTGYTPVIVSEKIEKIKEVKPLKTGGYTSLYDAIGKTFNELKLNKKTNVLINIYTDGAENSSRLYNKETVSRLIKEYSTKNVVCTFIGTKYDVDYVVSNIGIDSSNTAVYNGSAEELASVLKKTSIARTAYSAKLSKGEDVSKGFYKELL